MHAVTTSSSWLRKQNRDKKAEQLEEEEEEEEDSEDKDDHEQRDSSLPMRVAISRSFPATAGESFVWYYSSSICDSMTMYCM